MRNLTAEENAGMLTHIKSEVINRLCSLPRMRDEVENEVHKSNLSLIKYSSDYIKEFGKRNKEMEALCQFGEMEKMRVFEALRKALNRKAKVKLMETFEEKHHFD